MMRTGRLLFALVLIVMGALLLLINLSVVDLALYTQWPLFLILAGLGMWTGFLDNKQTWGLVIPGTILLCIGVLFYCCSVISWRLMGEWWPVFVIAPGLGLFMAYLVGERTIGLLIPASILTGIGLIMILQIQLRNMSIILPAAFIVAGVIVLITALRRRKA